MDNILATLKDDELDTLVEFKANGFKLSSDTNTQHLSDGALDYMSELKKGSQVVPAKDIKIEDKEPKKEAKGFLTKAWNTFSAVSSGTNLASQSYNKLKQWWNDDESINHKSKIDNDFRHNVSALSNPQDTTLVGMAGDLLDSDYLKDKGKRTYTPDDIKDYQQNVIKVAEDKYDIKFDKKSGLPSARLKGTNDDYEPVLNDIGDASADELETRIGANLAQVGTEIGLDIGATIVFDRKIGKHIKHPALRFIADGMVATGVAPITSATGSVAQTVYSGENISTDRLIEKAKEEALDNTVATATSLGAIGVLTLGYKGAKKINPIHSVKSGKDSYLDKELYENEQVSIFTGTKKREIRQSQLQEQAIQKAQSDDVYEDFGGIKEQSETLELAGQSNTKEILGNHYNHSQERINAEIQNSIQLTKNFKDKFNLDDIDSANLYRLARGGAKRIKNYYSNLYKNSKQLIEDEIGDTHIQVTSLTKQKIDNLLNVAKNPTNVANEIIEEPVKNRFNKDYLNLLHVVNSQFENTNSFTIKKLFEVQKTFNSFTSAHKDRFTYEQLELLDSVKDAIYDDINTAIKQNIPNKKLQDEFSNLWSMANSEYKSYKKLLKNEDLFRKLLDKNEKFDVTKFVETAFKDINKVNHDDINIIAIFGQQLNKVGNKDALSNYYSAVLDGLLKAKKVDVKTGESSSGIMQTFTHKNRSIEIMNFDAFHKIFSSIDDKQLNKIFGQSKHGKKILFHLKNFNELAKKEAILQQNLIGNEFKYAQSAMQEHEIGKIAYSTAFGLKFGAWRWLSKNFIRSKAYEEFLLRAISKPRYEDIASAIKKLDYDQKDISPMQRVDINSLRADLQAMKIANKKASEFIQKKPDATKEEIEQVTISGLLEYKPFRQVGIRDFDVERIQAKQLAKDEHLPQEIIDRITNLDELGREIKSFNEANREIIQAHLKYPRKVSGSPELSDDEIKALQQDNVKDSKQIDEVKQSDEIQAMEIEKEDFTKFLVDSGVKEQSKDSDIIIQEPKANDVDMLQKALNKQNFLKNLEDKIYNEPPLKQISQDDKLNYKQYEKMFTTFQGGKRELSAIVPQYTKKAFTKEQREKITTINDYFGGGGTWGAFFARLHTQFPNVKELKVHEFNKFRAIKINYLHHKPQALIDTLKNDKLVFDLLSGIRQMSKEKGDKGSHGVLTPYINKLLEQHDKGEIATKLTQDQIATLYLVADYSARGIKEVSDTLEYLSKQVKGVADQIALLKSKGVDIKVYNHSSYDDIKSYDQGDSVLSIVDPPYYKTNGYDIFDGEKLIKSDIVDIDIYEKTAKLLENIKQAGNLGIYTDESWEIKSVKLPKKFKNITDDGKSDYEVLNDISNNNGYLFRVPEKIGKTGGLEGRTEVLGLINAKGKIDDTQYNRPNYHTTNDESRPVPTSSNQRGSDTPTKAMEQFNNTDVQPSQQRGTKEHTEESRRHEHSRGSNTVSTKVDYEQRAKDLNENPPSFEELRALENLESNLNFSKNVFVPMRANKTNSHIAKLYDEAVKKHKSELPRATKLEKYKITNKVIENLENLRGYFKYMKDSGQDNTGFGSIANGNQFKALIYDLKNYNAIKRQTPQAQKEYEDIFIDLNELYEELEPEMKRLYGSEEIIDESHIPFAKFGDNLFAGTLAGVQTDEDGNIVGFDEENFIKGFASYTVAKQSAKYIIKKYKPQEKIKNKIQKFIDGTEEEMAKMAGGGKPPKIDTNIKDEFKDEDGFYSVLEKVVDTKVGGKIDTKSLSKLLEKNGVKQDELEWSGLKELMENNEKLTKEQIEDTVLDNRLIIQTIKKDDNIDVISTEETEMLEGMILDDIWNTVYKFNDEQKYIIIEEAKQAQTLRSAIEKIGRFDEYKALSQSTRDSLHDSWRDYVRSFKQEIKPFSAQTKHGDYTLGDKNSFTNYQELLFRTPSQINGAIRYIDGDDGYYYAELPPYDGTNVVTSAINKNGLEYELTKKEFRNTTHYYESNILVSARVDDRTIDNKKTLFIEELQSDWHQQGRKDGYGQKGVPDAPFKKNWTELGIKRLIQESVANDYDKIAWTTGTQQANRYNLAKSIDSLKYRVNVDGEYTVSIFTKQAGHWKTLEDVDDKVLVENFGEEIASKIISNAEDIPEDGSPWHKMYHTELEMGGDGMKVYYDKIVTNTFKKLFKKYKVKPKMEELDDLDEMVWSIELPKQMKEDIGKLGQPLYMIGGTVVGLEAINQGSSNE